MSYPFSEESVLRRLYDTTKYAKSADDLFRIMSKRYTLFEAVAAVCSAKLAEHIFSQPSIEEDIQGYYKHRGFFLQEYYPSQCSSYSAERVDNDKLRLETRVTIPVALGGFAADTVVGWPLRRRIILKAVFEHSSDFAVREASQRVQAYSCHVTGRSTSTLRQVGRCIKSLGFDTKTYGAPDEGDNPLNGLLVFETFARILVTEASKQPTAIRKWLLDVVNHLGYDQLLPRSAQIEILPEDSDAPSTGVENTGQWVSSGP